MTSPFTEASLKKLTVPQLKALCKEKCLVGYSKLPKDPIIARLLEWQNKQVSSAAGLRDASLILEDSALKLASGQTNSESSVSVVCLSQLQPPRAQEEVSTIVVPIAAHRHEAAIGNTTRADAPSPDVLENRDTTAILKRSRQELETPFTSRLPKKKARVNTLPATTDSCSRTTAGHVRMPQITPTLIPRATKELVPEVQRKTQLSINEASQRRGSQIKAAVVQPVKSVPRRFKALIPAKNGGPILPSVTAPIMSTASDESAHSLEKGLIHSGYLDFTPEEPISLKTISLPPSLAQRKHVPTLSLILSGISLQDLKACALVSRSFRYSAYLSASHQLARSFPGARLREVLQRYPQKIINLWPYLRLRDQETKMRKRFYEGSFLCRASKGLFEIDEHLWTSPDNGKQASIAVRFLMTKLFFLVSIGGDEYRQTKETGVVLKAEEIVKNEIWKIKYRSSSSIQTFYVLESTCEVIGNAEISSNASTPPPINLRADWSAYIQNRLGSQPQTNDGQHFGLSEHIQWSNHEEYDGGISKLWLKRITGEGEAGMAKLTVAQRYIFACVVSNSISGPWRTSNEMAQDFNGHPVAYSNFTREPKAKAQRINLFIPAHHHVESIHFTSSNGQHLHPAIAVVQTPGREYFILRDNGMQVGCEEEGIALVWMEMLGCNQNGCLYS